MPKKAGRVALPPVIFLLLLVVGACGPFQAGIESAPPVGRPSVTAGLPATPSPDRAVPTIVALETANAEMVIQVATLTAAQDESRPRLTQPGAAPLTTALPPVRITFPPGSASATVSPDLLSGVPQIYILKVLGGQHLLVNADRDLQLAVTGPDGRPLAPVTAGPRQWDYAVTTTGDQALAFSGSGPVTITIYVPPLATPTP